MSEYAKNHGKLGLMSRLAFTMEEPRVLLKRRLVEKLPMLDLPSRGKGGKLSP
jgi:hypothetical protein